MARPRKFEDVDNIQKHIDEYFKYREEINKVPTIESLSVWLGIDRNTLLNYEKREGYEKFFGTIKEAKDRILSEFIDDSLDSKNNALRIFLLKNNHGYRDQQEVKMSNNYIIDF